jgi:hypothetical protein
MTFPSTTDSNDLNLVVDLEPAQFDSFTKILNLLQDNSIISIRNSKIIQSVGKGSTFFTTDITSIIGPDLDLDFSSPKRVISVFKLIKSANNIKIYDDAAMNRYKLVSDESIFYLLKSSQEVEDNNSIVPLESDLVVIGETISLAGDSKNRAKNYISKTEKDYVDLLIEGNQLKAVYIPDDIIYHFNDFKNVNLDNANAELLLRSFSFLSIDGEEFHINLTKHNNRYLVKTMVKTAFSGVIINVYEYVDPATFADMMLI